jgi:hypothetical protein
MVLLDYALTTFVTLVVVGGSAGAGGPAGNANGRGTRAKYRG